MTTSVFGALNRREFLSTTAAAALMASASMPKIAFGAEKVVKIGFLAPLTGAVSAWGKPGLDGLQIWADRVNEAGGIPIGGDSYKVEFVAYDDEYDPGKARTGAVKLIKEDGVKFIMMLGGDPWPGVSPGGEQGEDAGLHARYQAISRLRPRCWSRHARCIRSTTSPASSGWRRTSRK